jgi:hypothetical protein
MLDQFIARDLGGDGDMGLLSTLGQHNDVVLGEVLGLGGDELKELGDVGVIGTRPGLI